MIEENYSERYERLKKIGATVPVQFLPKMYEEEQYLPVTSLHVNGVIDGRYMVSNLGNVYDCFKGDLVKFRCHQGYYVASLVTKYGSKDVRINRLVLLVFDYNPNYKNLQANHIDGNLGNNNLANLEWTTPKENSDHAMLYGLHKMNGTDNPNNKLTEEQVKEICELIQTGKYYDTEIADMYGVTYTNVSDIHKGKIWTRVSKNYDLSKRKPLKLTEEDVRGICEMLETGKYFTTEIAKKYNTTHENVIQIRKGKIWTHISKDYNIDPNKIPRKFTEDQIREMCEMIQTGKYYDREIAAKFNTSGYMIASLRNGKVHRDITKDYDLTLRKPRQIKEVPLYRGDTKIN